MGIRMNIHQHARTSGGALDSFVGSARWRERLKSAPASVDQICSEITGEFQENLRGLDYNVVDRDHIPVRTDQNVLLYYVIFASKDERGNDFWRKVKVIDAYGQRKLPLA